jgi:hypothetical protein
MSDTVWDGPDQLLTGRRREHAAGTVPGSRADRSRMIAVIPETISGRYLDAIPADSEDRSRD